MTTKTKPGVLVLGGILTVISAIVLFNSLDSDTLWKKIAAGIGFLGFGFLFVMGILNLLKSGKSRHT